MSHSAINAYKDRDRKAAVGRLRMAKAYQHKPQALSSDDLRNVGTSVQWCYHNEQWQMVADFVLYLHDFLEQQGFWGEGVRFVNWALEAAEALGEPGLAIRPRLLFNLGLFYDRQGKLTEAEPHFQACAHLASQLEQPAVLADAQHRLGWIAHSRRDYTQAERLYLEAKLIRETLNPPDPLALSRSWHQLGILAQDMGDFQAAQTYYDQSLALRRAEAASYLVAASLHQMATLAVAQKDWPQTTVYLTEAITIQQTLKDRAGEAYALDQLGVVAQQQQQWSTARTHYLNSLKLKEALGDTVGLLRAKMHLGEVCLAQKKFDEAKDWFEDSLKDSQNLAELHFQAQAHLKLGTLCYLTTETEKAVTHYQQSYQLFTNLDGTWREQAGILYQLGLIAHNQKQFAPALQMYQAGLAIQEREGFVLDAAMTHLQLGMIYQACDHYDVARQHYECGRVIFKKEGSLAYLAQTIYRLGNIAELTGQPDQACHYYRQAEALCHLHRIPPMRDLAAAQDRVKIHCL